MEGHNYGRGGAGRGRGSGGRGGGYSGSGGRGRGGGGGGRGRGGGGGGRGRGNQQYQYSGTNYSQQPQPQGPPQQSRSYQQGNQWGSGPTNLGRGGPNPNWGAGVNDVSSRGQPQSSSRNYAAEVRPSSETRGLVPKMQSIKLSEGASQSSATGALVPIRRPDNGGMAKIRYVNILVNHFPVSFNPESTIWHYDIDIKSDIGSSKGRPVKISKANLSLALEKLFSENPDFPLEMTAFDGEKNVFSAVRLPVGKFTVDLSSDEDVRSNSYTFTVTQVNELKLHKLKNYLTGDVLQLPREVLQGMDVVMKENPRRHMVSIGRSFHPKDSRGERLHYGLEASEGFQHSLKPTSQGLALCLDYSVLAVRMKISVLEFLREHLELTEFTMKSFRARWRDIESALRGLKVTVTHRRTKQKYTVSGLTEQRACDITFVVDDPEGRLPPTSTRLLDYFRDKYPGLVLEHEDIPCLNLGKGKKANYVPIELCVLVECQRYPKEDLDFDSARILKNISLARPEDRRRKICSMLQDDQGPCGGEVSKNFGLDVTMDMTRVQGRVIQPPRLKLRSPSEQQFVVDVDKDSCQWNLKNKLVAEGMSLMHWAVLDFSANERDRLNNNFIQKLVDRCNKLGMQMAYPLFVIPAQMRDLRTAVSLTPLLERVHYEARQASQGKNLQLLLCVMSRRDAGYKYIKWVSETKIGILTQCCLSKSANKSNDQYLAQLGMKINAKLGGSNTELYNQLPVFEPTDHVMVIGADVNHPRPMDLGSPSIAAVVASTNWPAANKYNPRVNFQRHRMEEIKNFGSICLELVESYEKINKVKPSKLVIFRDGVSEAQLDMVLNKELLDLKSVFEAVNYNPTITLVVARKRHQTRLFPAAREDGGKSGNIPPGTVVDTTIVHPLEFDFYLCSHYGGIGTSKPTHYFVPYDEHNFTSDELQKFIYYLCFVFARCCKPVSLVPPVYYADLLAYRGRLYYDAQSETLSSSGMSSSSSATSSSSSSATMSDLNVLLSGEDNGMFFI